MEPRPITLALSLTIAVVACSSESARAPGTADASTPDALSTDRHVTASDTSRPDSGATSDAALSTCATTVVGPSVAGAFDLVYENGNTHVVYLATLNYTPLYRERKAGGGTFTVEATFPSSGNYFGYADVAVAMTGASLHVLLAHKTVSTHVFDRSGTTFVPGEGLPGLSSARLLRLRSVVDSGGGFSAAAIFDYAGGLYYRHLTPGSITWPLPNIITASYTSVSLAFAPDGSMVAAYGKKDGAVTGVRWDKTDKPQGSLQLTPPSSATGEFAVAATASEVSLLYSSTAWFVRTASGSEQLPNANAKVGLGTPDLVLGPDGALRAVVYEPPKRLTAPSRWLGCALNGCGGTPSARRSPRAASSLSSSTG